MSISILAFAGMASADNLTYSVIGYGGFSSPVTQVSQNGFWWAASDTPNNSTVSGSVLTSYGFDPLSGSFNGVTPAPFSHNDLYNGSLLLSSPFTVNGSQGLTVNFGEVTARSFDYGNFEFAVLLQNSQTVAIIGLVAPMNLVSPEDEPFLGNVFTPLSSGAQMTSVYYHAGYSGTFQLGNTQFGGISPNCDSGPCEGLFTSTYTPNAGTYQLLFGSFGNGNNFPSAVTVQSVNVPENSSLVFVIFGIVAILFTRYGVIFLKTAARSTVKQ
jgi:hypothetical protein